MNQTMKSSLTCSTCNTSFATIKEENEHQFSLMHHIRLDQANKGKKGFRPHICSLCSLHIGCLNNYVAHLDGKKHKANLARFRTFGDENFEENKKNKQENLGSLKAPIYDKQDTLNESRKVSSPETKSNDTTLCSNSENDHVPMHGTSKANISHSFSRKIEHWTEDNSYDYTDDDYDYFQGWNFSNSQYHNYPQFHLGADNWGQQDYNNYWCNKEFNEYSQENYSDYQHSNNMNNYRSPQRNYYKNCKKKKPNRFQWNKNVNVKLSSQQKLKRDELSVNYRNNQTIRIVNRRNQYHEEKSKKNDGNICSLSAIKCKDLPLNKRLHNEDSLPIKEQALKQKSKPVINKTWPKYKQNKLRLLEKNVKVTKVDKCKSQRNVDKWNKPNPFYKHVKPPISAKTSNNNYPVSAKVPAAVEDLNMQTDLLPITPGSNKNGNNEKSCSRLRQLNETSDILHSTKLSKLSQILEESKLEFCPFDKELINKLVNFPRSRKEQLQLGKWIQEHSRTKKKLTLPRFNLHMVPSQNVKNQSEDSSAFLHSVVSEVVNNLQENVIDSILLAIKNSEGEIIHNTAEDSKGDNCMPTSLQNFAIKTEQNKCHLPNLLSAQLSHAEKIHWLQNWITEACKPQNTCVSQRTEDSMDQNKEVDVDQNTKNCFSHSAKISKDQNTNISSFQNSDVHQFDAHSEELFPGGDINNDSAVSSQNDNRNSSMQAVQNKFFSQEMPMNPMNVKQEALSENEDSAWCVASAEKNDDSDKNQVGMFPACNPENENFFPTLSDSEHQISSTTKYTTASNMSQEQITTGKNQSCWDQGLCSGIPGKVPLEISKTDLSSENLNPSNILIKTEPEVIYDDNEVVKEHEFCNNSDTNTNCNKLDSEKVNFNSRNDAIESSGDTHNASLDTMINSLGADSFCNDNPSTTINHVKDMLNKNKVLLEQITELMNLHIEHSKTNESSCENLIQEILATSQKEEELRLLGSRIDRIISYFFRFAQEWKDKRTQAFYEEMKLRTRRIQLLEQLKEQYPKNEKSSNEAGANSSSNLLNNSKSDIGSLDQSNIDELHYTNDILTSHNSNLNNTCNVSENHRQKTPDFINKISSHSTISVAENNVLRCKNTCESDIKKGTTEKKRKQLSSNSSSPESLDLINSQVANNSGDDKTSALKRRKIEKNTISAERVGNVTYPTRTLAEENERFWTEMEAWLQDLDHNSQSLEKKGYMKQSDEVEVITISSSEHVPTSASESSVKCVDDNSSLNQESLLINEAAFTTNHLEAHKSAVLDIKVHGGYLYTCSSDTSAKRFDLQNPTNIVLFSGHQKTVTSLQVIDLGNNKVHVFTSSMDGHLRCFDNNGSCLNEVKIGIPIICTAEDWGKLYLGLPTGAVALYNLTAKKIIGSFQCSKCAISSIATSSEGALKILCVASYDCAVTVWDASTGLLLRCLEGQAKPPCIVKISGNMVYTSTTKKTVLIHSLSSGKLHKVLNWPASATGLHVTGNYIISCSFDGMVRCYTKKEWMLHALYYGAGKYAILSMCIYNGWIFTGNRYGMIAAFKFNPSSVVPCQFGKCYFRFGRLEDLRHHLRKCHFPKFDDKLLSCAWRGCNVEFTSKTSNQEKEEHIFHHIKSTCTT